MIRTIIFDFDGVIVLSEKPRFEVIKKSAANYNVSIPSAAINKMVGKTTLTFLNEVIDAEDKHFIDKIIKDYEKEYKGNITKHVKRIDITVDFVEKYHGPIILALASMSSRRIIEEVTKYLNIYSKFKIIVSKEEVKHHKPNPEIYLDVAKKLNVLPEECVVIEDTVVGVQAALNAHMQCYVLLNTFNDKKEFTNMKLDGFIESYNDILNILHE